MTTFKHFCLSGMVMPVAPVMSGSKLRAYRRGIAI
ncbi:hypothetical protein QE435_004409 [Rhizobium sp. SORGH_AS 787]|nr:hypothetical protein [Rhizobium sp. SORGH_AS_0787]